MSQLQWHVGIDPFHEIRALQERVNRLFEPARGAFRVERGTSAFPPLDIRRDAENVYVTAEVPGVPLESLDVSITGETLTLKGERKAPEVTDERTHRRERRTGHFSRLVSLPDPVDASRIEATLKDGILRLRLPKAEAAKPRQVRIAQG
jgi:HSP20 family protein